jgi:hypothetical protein
MTIDGTLQISSAPVVADALATEPLTLPGCEVLQVMFEIASDGVLDLLPAALHPTDPRIVTFVFVKCPDGPLGPFDLAQTRIGCRAGVRPRGYVLRSVIDGADAADTLASRGGIATVPGTVSLRRGYHEIRGTVDGELDCALVDPRPLSGAEIQHAANMQLATVGGEPKLVQVDPTFLFHRAACGRPRLDGYVGELSPAYPVSAWWTLCDLTLPKVRYVLDPNVTALRGTTKVG